MRTLPTLFAFLVTLLVGGRVEGRLPLTPRLALRVAAPRAHPSARAFLWVPDPRAGSVEPGPMARFGARTPPRMVPAPYFFSGGGGITLWGRF